MLTLTIPAPSITTVHRPRMYFWVQIALVVVLFGVAAVVIYAAGFDWPWVSLTGALNGLLAVFVLLTAIGSRRLHITLSGDGVEFTLPRPGNTTLMPWMLLSAKVRWSEIRAIDVRERNVVMNKVCYILRTAHGDAFFFAPSWRHAEQLADEIVRRSGASTSYEDLLAPAEATTGDANSNDPARDATPAKPSLAEKAARVLGYVLAVFVGIAALFLVIAAFVCEPGERGGIWFALCLLWLPGQGAQALISFRRMR
ncbi:MAG: hypothetical protein ABI451_03135 [Dokdonella sp.]